jgi:hypothetical protein
VQYFPTVAVENTPNPFNLPLTWHGVNLAEGMKSLPATYRFTHNQSGTLPSLVQGRIPQRDHRHCIQISIGSVAAGIFCSSTMAVRLAFTRLTSTWLVSALCVGKYYG